MTLRRLAGVALCAAVATAVLPAAAASAAPVPGCLKVEALPTDDQGYTVVYVSNFCTKGVFVAVEFKRSRGGCNYIAPGDAIGEISRDRYVRTVYCIR